MTGVLESTSIQYFHFERDFVDDQIRCIPMVVRFKLDLCGIKLKLSEWCIFSPSEREELACMPCDTILQVSSFRGRLIALVMMRTGTEPSPLPIDQHPAWANLQAVNEGLIEKAAEYDCVISVGQWRALSELQRFALLKLFKPGHENKNFKKAMSEFGLIKHYGRQ